MTFMNRRNAVAGWLTIAVGKYILRRKAKSSRGRWAAIAVLIASVLGAVTFWKKRSGSDLAGAGAPLPPVAPAGAGESGDDGPPDEAPVSGSSEQVDPKG